MKARIIEFQICWVSVFFLVCGCEQKPTDGRVTHQQEAQVSIEQFRQAFAQKDSTVQVGTTLSNAVVAFGEPLITFTNADGSVEAHFGFMPHALVHAKVDTLTNGFTLLVSNGIIVRKAYSFTSSP